MKHIVMMSEEDCKEIVAAMHRLRYAVNSLEASYMAGELDAQLERIEKVFDSEDKPWNTTEI